MHLNILIIVFAALLGFIILNVTDKKKKFLTIVFYFLVFVCRLLKHDYTTRIKKKNMYY